MILLVRAIKPRLIHSHTIKANLISSITASFYGIPCIFSFAGMGNLSKQKGFKRQLLLLTLRIIKFSSIFQRVSLFGFKKNLKRTFFIFQNPRDMKNFGNIFSTENHNQNKLIIGSGVPHEYFIVKNSNSWLEKKENIENFKSKITFFYCGRLLRSKGIQLFIDLSYQLQEYNFKVYGDIDPSNEDSLKFSDISKNSNNSSNLQFCGHQNNPLLNNNKNLPILILPSNYGEGLPRTIVEALALKIPIISSLNATCDIFTEKHIYISNLDKLENYIFCIEKIIDDFKNGKLSLKLENGYEFAKNHLSEKIVVDRTLEIYKEIDQLNY